MLLIGWPAVSATRRRSNDLIEHMEDLSAARGDAREACFAVGTTVHTVEESRSNRKN